jgi:hypothetical protein
VLHSLVDLQAAINRYLTEHNHDPKPFVWTADPDTIIAAARRGYQVLDSIQSRAIPGRGPAATSRLVPGMLNP